jgi:hypothetical protein
VVAPTTLRAVTRWRLRSGLPGLPGREQATASRWVSRWGSRLGAVIAYSGALTVAGLALRARPPADQHAWLAWASTNLANLHEHPIGSLVASAFLTEDFPTGWIMLAAVGLGATGWVLGSWRTALLGLAAHVVGTLVSEGILAHRISTGAAPAADRQILDVGASYVVVSALAAGIAYSRWPGRLLCAVGLAAAAPSLFGGLTSWEVSSIGHVCSILVGLALGWPLTLHRSSEPSRYRRR